jgi:recombination protein RecA
MAMNAAAIPSDVLQQLQWKHEYTPEHLNTGVNSVDQLIEGCPRGRITEIVGPVSSGRTSLLGSILAEATRQNEFCAVIDTNNAFDPVSADAAGVDLRHLIWVRCNGNPEHALKSADLLVHSGGFGVIALDLCEVPARVTRRIPLSWWYRFRRAIENTPSVFLVLENEPTAKACASLLLEMKRDGATFAGTVPFQVLDHTRFEAHPRKPVRSVPARFEAHSLR